MNRRNGGRGWSLLAATGGLVLALAGLLCWTAAGPAAAPASPPATASPGPTPAQRAPPAASDPATARPAAAPRPTAPATPSAAPAPGATRPPAAFAPLARPIRYAALGASDTVGVGTLDPARQNWTARLAAQLPADTVYAPFARSGITLREALQVEVPAAIRFRPTFVTVWLVVNDALQGVPVSVYRQELKSLLDRLTGETGATILLLNAPDIGHALQPAAPTATRLQVRAIAAEWDQAIAQTAVPYGARVRIVDLFGPSEQAAAHPKWIAPDNFHPSAAGYQVIADLCAATLRGNGLLP